MVTKSLLQFTHTSIGSKTHKARTATAHVSYIMRSDAMTKFQCEHMPDGGRGTRVFFDRLWEKAGMPESARVCDKLMLALPLELGQEQRYDAVGSFMQKLGQGRIAWCAAHHDSGEDSHNPHAHIVFKDADIGTGRKVIGTTTSSRDVREAEEHGWKVPPRTTTADMRKMWCEHLNDFMERAGLDIRYDPRTLKEQGVFREAQIHVGPKAQALDEKGHAFESQDRMRNGHSLPYTLLDEGSRVTHNKRIIEANKERELARDSSPEMKAARAASPLSYSARAPLPLRPLTPQEKEQNELQKAQVETRKALYAEQKRDREALGLSHDAAKLEHEMWGRKLYAGARQAAYDTIEEQYAAKWLELRANTPLSKIKEAANALKAEQKKAYAEEAKRQVDLRRPEKDAAWKALKESQEKERNDLRTEHRKEISTLSRQHVAERLGVQEKWLAQTLDKKSHHIMARLSSRQSMATQQPAAHQTIKLHAKASLGETTALPSNPREAARRFFELAHKEKERQEAIRQKLLDDRRKRLELAGRATETGREKKSPRQTILPGILAARDNRGASLQRRQRETDPQQQIRQKELSGQSLNSAERANATPEIRQRLSARERRAQAIRDLMRGSSGRENSGKGRSGGGRGR